MRRTKRRCSMKGALEGMFAEAEKPIDWSQLLVPAGLVAMFVIPLFARKKAPAKEEEKENTP